MDIHKNTHGVKEGSKGRDIHRKKSSNYSAKKAAMKVVYISTPMKVKTSASKFRAIVQELTGRESDVVRIMETSGGRDTWDMVVPNDHDNSDDGGDQRSGSSPTSSSEEEINNNHNNNMIINPFDGVFGTLDANLLYDQFCHQLDVLGSY